MIYERRVYKTLLANCDRKDDERTVRHNHFIKRLHNTKHEEAAFSVTCISLYELHSSHKSSLTSDKYSVCSISEIEKRRDTKKKDVRTCVSDLNSSFGESRGLKWKYTKIQMALSLSGKIGRHCRGRAGREFRAAAIYGSDESCWIVLISRCESPRRPPTVQIPLPSLPSIRRRWLTVLSCGISRENLRRKIREIKANRRQQGDERWRTSARERRNMEKSNCPSHALSGIYLILNFARLHRNFSRLHRRLFLCLAIMS